MPRYPFPPVVRWLVAPGIAAGSGTLVGFLLAVVQGTPVLQSEEFIQGGGLALAAMCGVSFSAHPVPILVFSGLLPLIFLASGSFGLPAGWRPPGLWVFGPETVMAAGLAGIALGIPHGMYVAKVLQERRSVLVFYVLAGLVWGVLASGLMPGREKAFVVFGVLLSASQYLGMATVSSLAARLDRRP